MNQEKVTVDRYLHIGREYKHFKGKRYYPQKVVKNADNPEQLMVVYCDPNAGEWWVRSLDEFLSEVDHEKYPDVKQRWRFECAEDEDQE